MIVVADTTPLHYLTLIGAVNVLPPLYDRVLVPQTVAAELQQPNTPTAVRVWIAQPPAWCEIHPDPPIDPALASLDAGERAAITLTLAVHADGLLIDELQGRSAALRRHLHVTGTLGVLGMRTWPACSISKRPWRNCAAPISTSRTPSLAASASGSPGRRTNHDPNAGSLICCSRLPSAIRSKPTHPSRGTACTCAP